MDFHEIITFTIMVMLLTVMPGPNTALIIKSITQSGRRAGLLNLAGIVSAFSIHGICSILGLSALILKTSQLFFFVKTLGAIYLLYLGLTSLWQAIFPKRFQIKKEFSENRENVVFQDKRLFLEGFLTNILNPKASMFYIAVFPQFIDPGVNHVLAPLVLVGIHSLTVSAWFFLVIFTIGKAAGTLSSLTARRMVQGATGSVLLWFGYRLFTYQQKT